MTEQLLFRLDHLEENGKSSRHMKHTQPWQSLGLAALAAESGSLDTSWISPSLHFFFSIASAQKILSNFSAVQQYVSELRNHCIILFKSLISCNHASKLWFWG